jgi:hypothetical protein
MVALVCSVKVFGVGGGSGDTGTALLGYRSIFGIDRLTAHSIPPDKPGKGIVLMLVAKTLPAWTNAFEP